MLDSPIYRLKHCLKHLVYRWYILQTTKLYEILSSYNRYWTTGDIDAGIKRDLLPDCIGQLDSKEVIVLKGVRRCGKSTLMAQVIRVDLVELRNDLHPDLIICYLALT